MDCGLEYLLLMADGQPLMSFKGARGEEYAPVNHHAFGVVVDEVGQE